MALWLVNIWTKRLWIRYRVVGVPRLDAQLCQDPNAVGELEGLVEHVLAFHVPFGDSVDVVVLKLPRHCVCKRSSSVRQ